MIGGVDQMFGTFQVEYLFDLPGIDQAVASHDKFIVGDGSDDFPVETHDFNQTASFHVHQSRLADGLSDDGTFRGDQQFHGVVGSCLEIVVSRLAIWQQAAQDQDGNHPDDQAEQPRQSGDEYVHGFTGVFLVETGNNQVGRRTDKRTHPSHARSIAQWNKQARRRNAQFLSPHLDHIQKQRHHRSVVEHATGSMSRTTAPAYDRGVPST